MQFSFILPVALFASLSLASTQAIRPEPINSPCKSTQEGLFACAAQQHRVQLRCEPYTASSTGYAWTKYFTCPAGLCCDIVDFGQAPKCGAAACPPNPNGPPA